MVGKGEESFSESRKLNCKEHQPSLQEGIKGISGAELALALDPQSLGLHSAAIQEFWSKGGVLNTQLCLAPVDQDF